MDDPDCMMPDEYYAAIEAGLGRAMTATERKRASRTYGQDTNARDVEIFLRSVPPISLHDRVSLYPLIRS